jgi:hypothetical protein
LRIRQIVGPRQAGLHRVEHVSAGVERDQPALLRFGHVKSGVGHAERIENARLEEGIEGFSGDDLDDAAKHVGRH